MKWGNVYTKWLNMCNQYSQKVIIKIEKCKITEWVGLLGMLGHWNQDSFTHSRELWRYKIEEMSVKIGIKFFLVYKEEVRFCLVWDLQNANYIA